MQSPVSEDRGDKMMTENELATAIFQFLTHKYVQRADSRQEGMGLIYMNCETHDLSEEIARFVVSLAK
jgi:hypothetical protein